MSLESQLKKQEGFSAKLYQDNEGVWTIGWGTNIETITGEEAEWLFNKRLDKVKADLLKALPWVTDLDQVRQDVLFNMAYNLGVKGLLGFKDMLGHVKRGEWEEAAAAGLDSKWRYQVKGRAIVLMKQLKTGVEVV